MGDEINRGIQIIRKGAVAETHCVTVGRKKRKRKKGAGTGVKIKSHTRSPRGSNKGKKPVRVDGYKRGKPPKKGSRRRKR